MKKNGYLVLISTALYWICLLTITAQGEEYNLSKDDSYGEVKVYGTLKSEEPTGIISSKEDIMISTISKEDIKYLPKTGENKNSVVELVGYLIVLNVFVILVYYIRKNYKI